MTFLAPCCKTSLFFSSPPAAPITLALSILEARSTVAMPTPPAAAVTNTLSLINTNTNDVQRMLKAIYVCLC